MARVQAVVDAHPVGVEMATFIALLRGVNVGKAKRVPMATFRSLLGDLGYTDVATLLNSGNAVFRAAKGSPAKHAARISKAIAEALEIEVPVIVKTGKELSAIIAESPIAAEPEEHARFLVLFVQDKKTLPDLVFVEPLVGPSEQFAICEQAAYILCGGGILKSKVGSALLKQPATSVTTRNWATVLKLQALASAAGSS